MIKYILILLLFIGNLGYSQENKASTEGYYNLSSFEVSSGLYLLKTNTFFYFSYFGNVDLKVFGTYSISDKNKLTFSVDDSLKEEFQIYGLKTEAEQDSLKLFYNQPYVQKVEKLFLKIKDETINFPEFDSVNTVSELNIKHPKIKNIHIGYIDESNDSLIRNHFKTFSLENTVSEVKIYHNYYYDMTLEIGNMSFFIKDFFLMETETSENKIQRKDINQKVIDQVTSYISQLKNKTSVVRSGKVYYKL